MLINSKIDELKTGCERMIATNRLETMDKIVEVKIECEEKLTRNVIESESKIDKVKSESNDLIAEVKNDSSIMHDKLRIDYDDKINNLKQLTSNNMSNNSSEIEKKMKEYIELDLKKMNKANYFTQDEYNLLNEWMPSEFKCFNPVLIYKATRDTFAASAFRSKADGIINTIFIGTTESGVKFGVFTVTAFKNENSWGTDSSLKSFVFSLTKKVKCNLTDHRYAIYNGYGPIYGSGFNLYICDNSNINASSYSALGGAYGLKEKLFEDGLKMKELEFYKI